MLHVGNGHNWRQMSMDAPTTLHHTVHADKALPPRQADQDGDIDSPQADFRQDDSIYSPQRGQDADIFSDLRMMGDNALNRIESFLEDLF